MVFDQARRPVPLTWRKPWSPWCNSQDDDPSGEPGFQGIFSYSNEGVCSWYDLAVGIMRYTGVDLRRSSYPQ